VKPIKFIILKKFTIKTHKIKRIAFVGMFFFLLSANAQIQNNGNLYVGSAGNLFLNSGAFSFGSTAKTATLKTGGTPGKISLASGATFSNSSATQFVDGLVSTLGTTSFTFPIGEIVTVTEFYAPIIVTPVSGSTGVNAAYFRDNTTTIGSTTTLDASLSQISALEYWKISGSNATITLTWNAASTISTMTTSQLADVTIAGYRTSTQKWEAVASLVDITSVLGGSSTITTGSVTATGNVTLSNYDAFSIGLKVTVCPELFYTGGSFVTWNGSFPTTPTLADGVTISTAGSPGSFVCNILVLDADITLTDGQTIEVVNGITGNGKIIMSSLASVVQRATGTGVSKPTIQLTKATRPLRKYDYSYIGSPIEENAFPYLNSAKAVGANLGGAFDRITEYLPASSQFQYINTTIKGQGIAVRVRDQAPLVDATTSAVINYTFSGRANNGDITVPVTLGTGLGSKYNIIANPYPSPIDADTFLTANTAVDGVLYIWKQSAAYITGAYSQGDYMAYTRAGSTVASGISSTAFTGKIPSGQGFVVAANSTSNVTFTNCMRSTLNSAILNRTVNVTPIIDRYKLNITGSNNAFSQILISYLPEGTLAYDRMYDGETISGNGTQLYSILDNSTRKLTINARPNFSTSDAVPLGVSKSGTTLENFTLSIHEKEGIFASATPVFVHDLALNTYTDLTLSDYTFSSDAAVTNNRFEIVYQNAALNNPGFEEAKAIAYIKNGTLSVVASLGIQSIEIYDVTGRKVTSIKGDGSTSSTATFNFSEGIYIAKIKMNNGAIATKKLSNKK
jgi:hypothetical protein